MLRVLLLCLACVALTHGTVSKTYETSIGPCTCTCPMEECPTCIPTSGDCCDDIENPDSDFRQNCDPVMDDTMIEQMKKDCVYFRDEDPDENAHARFCNNIYDVGHHKDKCPFEWSEGNTCPTTCVPTTGSGDCCEDINDPNSDFSQKCGPVMDKAMIEWMKKECANFKAEGKDAHERFCNTIYDVGHHNDKCPFEWSEGGTTEGGTTEGGTTSPMFSCLLQEDTSGFSTIRGHFYLEHDKQNVVAKNIRPSQATKNGLCVNNATSATGVCQSGYDRCPFEVKVRVAKVDGEWQKTWTSIWFGYRTWRRPGIMLRKWHFERKLTGYELAENGVGGRGEVTGGQNSLTFVDDYGPEVLFSVIKRTSGWVVGGACGLAVVIGNVEEYDNDNVKVDAIVEGTTGLCMAA